MPNLDEDEISAAKAYAADSTFFHALKLGWAGDPFRRPEYLSFLDNAGKYQNALDGAIGKGAVDAESVVYSGHGNSYGAVGSLIADASNFVGLYFEYPGYISTSLVESVARDFLTKRENRNTSRISRNHTPCRLSHP